MRNVDPVIVNENLSAENERGYSYVCSLEGCRRPNIKNSRLKLHVQRFHADKLHQTGYIGGRTLSELISEIKKNTNDICISKLR